MKKILAVNSGSSSFKYKLFAYPEEKVIASGMADSVGLPNSVFKLKLADGTTYEEKKDIPNQEAAVQKLLSWLKKYKVINDLSELGGIGHRVVAGGEEFKDSTIITQDNIWKIYDMSDYAPLHNAAEADGIYAFMKVLPDVPEVAVFDTSFHQTLDPVQYLYSVSYDYYLKYRARKYGAHGTSVRYVVNRAAELLNKPVEDLKMIVCHLGSGASVTAVKNGKSFDTSMGFSPVAGLTMSTRSGDIDPSVVQFIMKKTKITKFDDAINLLNNDSGLAGISGVSPDMREIRAEAEKGNRRAQLALDIFVNRIVRYIGEYFVEMGGADVLIFTAGIGENEVPIRKAILEQLHDSLGVVIDEKENAENGEKVITKPESKITGMIVPTNEELMIARDVVRLTEE
ncbi:acetate/propionate family kinase [Lactobacillus sp. PV012]|uniref:acetate/propionate family kinase n=1 Tax=Lactobacillus sp. PV012 TaxID=2594494 RepID=UPI00223F0A37|nr:acetate kinase [Lactobacillus sp. PV012]QNQ82512.1 acetate kinase [Lactobacillus sp. PV012]